MPGLFVAAGFNSIGIQSAGGAGMALAHWIVNGAPPMDLSDVDIRRFEPFHNTEMFLRERTVEGLGLLYAMHWPHRQYETARGIRRSPLHDRLEAAGACFGSVMGWERANFFARPELGIEAEYEYSFGRQNWHEANALEHKAVREGVGLFDLTSFAKFSVQGRDAATVMDRMASGDVAGAVGASTYTQWLNEEGGIEADLTVSRIAEDEFWVIGGAGTRSRDVHSIREAIRNHPGGPANATVTDITSAYAVIAVMGPQSRTVLQSLTEADMSEEAFPFATNQEIDLGMAIVRANRMSYVGELGWELYVPTEFAVYVYDLIMASHDMTGSDVTGSDVTCSDVTGIDVTLCGYHTLNSLRFEKGYRHWGHEITPDDSPVQAGLSFAVAWDKPGDFIGRAAVEAQKADGVDRRLVQVAIHDENAMILHHEPLYRNGERVGYVTDGMWGHTVGAACGMAWAYRDKKVTAKWINDAEWTVELPSGMYPAKVQLRPWL